MNISTTKQESVTGELSELFKILGHPARLEILLEIGEGEACVCHLESVLGQRQAYISQHLMVLRDADLLRTRQEGRYVYYRLSDPELVNVIEQAGKLLGLPALAKRGSSTCDCFCPECHTK